MLDISSNWIFFVIHDVAESDSQGKESGEEYSKRLTKAVEEMEKVNNKQKEVEKQKAELQEAVRIYYFIQ